MINRASQTRLIYAVSALSLAVYGVVGVLGHGLHGLIPCMDGACVHEHAAAASGACCDHASHFSSNDSEDGEASVHAAGHDPDECSICLLLAKIKVGRVSVGDFGPQGELGCSAVAHVEQALPADLILSAAPRGPPAV